MNDALQEGVRAYLLKVAKNEKSFVKAIFLRLLRFCIGKRITPRKAYIVAFIVGNSLYDEAAATAEIPNLTFPKSHAMNLNIAFGWYFIVSNLEVTEVSTNDQNPEPTSGKIALVTVMMRSWVMDLETGNRIASDIPVHERIQVLDATYGATFCIDDETPHRVVGSHQVDSKLSNKRVTFPEKSYTVQTQSRNYRSEVNWSETKSNSAVDTILPLNLDWEDEEKDVHFQIHCKAEDEGKKALYFKEGYEGLYPFKSADKDWQYYSIAQIPTHGTVRHGSKEYTVKGTTWFDHQWAGRFHWSQKFHWKIVDEKFGGWCWFGFNLANGGAFTFCAIHEPKATLLCPSKKVKGPLKGFGKYLPPGFDQQNPANSKVKEHYLMGNLCLESEFKSPKTKASYPTHWKFDLCETAYQPGDQPSNMKYLKDGISLRMEMVPIAKNQLTEFGSSIEFWEGGATIHNGILTRPDGSKEKFEGEGFCESVGFQSSSRLGLSWLYELVCK